MDSSRDISRLSREIVSQIAVIVRTSQFAWLRGIPDQQSERARLRVIDYFAPSCDAARRSFQKASRLADIHSGPLLGYLAGRPAHDGPARRGQAWHGTDRQVLGAVLAPLRGTPRSAPRRMAWRRLPRSCSQPS